MSVAKILSKFQPNKKIFFTLFDEMAVNLKEVNLLLKQVLSSNDSVDRMTLLPVLNSLKEKNDVLAQQVVLALHDNFITPFDRLDIHEFSKTLCYISDSTCAVANRIILMDVQVPGTAIDQFVDLLEKGIHELSKAISELKHTNAFYRITESCFLINQYESKASDLLEYALVALYEEQKNPIEVIKIKIIYDLLMQVLDYCQDATCVLESIIVKSV
ncbi:MAG: hypothetical protein RL624_887 [Bacteroidota bacterium]|jgi:uncharacterized protein Yka (UPF0111/DUF47 family)